MILLSKDSKNKVRIVNIWYTFDSPVYTIHRQTGLFGGKWIDQPDLTIEKGKVKRTMLQQVELEFNSHVKKYLDRGYQKYDSLTKIPFEKITESEISELVGDDKTNQDGIIKPMLAKDYNKCSTDALEKTWWGSRKIDGCRCLMSWNGNEIIATSRGGGDYNQSTTHLRTNSHLVEFFQANPNIILDGELYKHGFSLQKISGLARLEANDPRTQDLEFWIYDMINLEHPNLSFEERKEILDSINMDYFEAINFNFDAHQIKFVPHKKMTGYAIIRKYHDQYVSEGFEGIVVRDPSKPYGIGKRTNDMIKVKEYMDSEFEITGFEEGLRDEDFVFTCVTKEGKSFKAKPVGTRELKDEYRDNMNQIIGKMATIKFFYYSEDKIPLQPVLKSIREYGE